MNWAWGAWLWGLVGIALLAVVLVVARRLHLRRLGQVFSAALLDDVLPRSVRRRRVARDVLGVVGLGLVVLALAEPRFDKQLRTVRARGTDVVVLLDLSRSMEAQDVDPSRLERARREISDLGRVIEGDRVGLVLFAGGAFPRLPLTEDFAALELVVSEASTDTFQSQGSDLATAMQVGLELLEAGKDRAGQAMLVISDGETHDPDEALSMADEVASQGVPVFAMGVGIEPAPIPLRSGRMLQHDGSTVMSEPDFTILEEVARRTAGAFVQSNASSGDVEGLYAQLRRSVTAVERDTQQRETWRSAFQWPLGLGLVALLLGAWLGDGRRAFGAAAAVVLVLGLTGPGTARAQDDVLEADQLYREGKFEQAARELTELSLERPDDPELFDRLGAARYRAGDFEGAARAWEWSAKLEGDADALYNAGNAHYQAGRLEDAQDRYERALEQQPGHPGAQQNRDLVVREIAARRQQPPPPPPKPDEGERQDPGGGEDEEDPQEGEPQEGEQQAEQGSGEGEGPESEGEPQPSQGEPGEAAQDGEGRPMGGKPSEGEPDEQGTSEAVDPSEVEEGEGGEPTDEQAAGGGDEGGIEGEGSGPITSGQAHRLLDSIEEGTQRVRVAGRPEDKPW